MAHPSAPLVSFFYPVFREIVALADARQERTPVAAARRLNELAGGLAAASQAARTAKRHEQDISEAAFAVAALADEEVIRTSGKPESMTELLQFRFFNTTTAGEDFYRRLEALAADRHDVREVYVTALLLGFTGERYRTDERASLAALIRAQTGMVPRLALNEDRPALLTPQPYAVTANAGRAFPPDWRACVLGLLTALLLVTAILTALCRTDPEGDVRKLFPSEACADPGEVNIKADDDGAVTVTGRYPWNAGTAALKEKILKVRGVTSADLSGFVPLRSLTCVKEETEKLLPHSSCYTVNADYDPKGDVRLSGTLADEDALKALTASVEKVEGVKAVTTQEVAFGSANPACALQTIEGLLPKGDACSRVKVSLDPKSGAVVLSGDGYTPLSSALESALKRAAGGRGLRNEIRTHLKSHACAAVLLHPAVASGETWISLSDAWPAVMGREVKFRLSARAGGYFYLGLYGRAQDGGMAYPILPGKALPNAHYSPQSKDEIGPDGLTFEPPAGEYLLTVLVSPEELHLPPPSVTGDKRPEAYRAEEYTEALKHALTKPGVKAQVLFFDVTESGVGASLKKTPPLEERSGSGREAALDALRRPGRGR